jgi:hypothetical protein
MVVCLYEDRAYQVPGVKILILSLNRYCSRWSIRLRFPGISDEFRKWVRQFEQVTLIEERLTRSGSYDVKPTVLLDGLNSGASECLWLDTDVIVNGPLDFIAQNSPETIIVAQDPWEYADGSSHRCKSWGLVAGRSLPGPLNSAVVRVSDRHASLLGAWYSLLSIDTYLAEKEVPLQERNHHLLSDQDGLSALLASEEFASFPLCRLRHATEILQHHGAGAYGLIQRWETLKGGLPPLVHAMGSVKPWNMTDRPSLMGQPRDYYERNYLELSPYVHLARQYRAELDAETDWLDIRTSTGRLGTMLGFNQPAFKGAAQAVLHRGILSRLAH